MARQSTSDGTDRRFPYRWNPRYPARVGVMPREGGDADVRWFDVEPCYVFHPMNAYADGDFACALPVEISAVPAALKIRCPA